MSVYNQNIAMPGYVGPVEKVNEVIDECRQTCDQAIELMNGDRRDEAINLLEKCIAEHPRWTPPHQVLAHLYLEEKRLPEARQTIRRLHELGHKDPEFLISLGATLLNRREFAEAILSLREARALGAEPGEWLLMLAEALHRTGRQKEAETLLEELRPVVEKQRSRLLVNLSALRLQQGRLLDAANLAQEALKAPKAKPRAFYFLGLALMQMGEPDAVTAFERFIKYQPHRVAPYRHLERLSREAGDDEQADAYLLRAREMLENRRMLRMEKARPSQGKPEA